MKRYLLDTTPLTGYLKGNVRATALIEPWILEREVATSILVYGEVTEHLKSLTDGRTYQEQLRELLVEIEPVCADSLHSRALRRPEETSTTSLRTGPDR